MNCIWTADYWRKRKGSQVLKCECSRRRESALTFSAEGSELIPLCGTAAKSQAETKKPLPAKPEGA
jgi:hypothetical protein